MKKNDDEFGKAQILPSGRVIPSLKSVEKYNRLSEQAQYCKRCGSSDVFDGVMFTNDYTREMCDDCYG